MLLVREITPNISQLHPSALGGGFSVTIQYFMVRALRFHSG